MLVLCTSYWLLAVGVCWRIIAVEGQIVVPCQERVVAPALETYDTCLRFIMSTLFIGESNNGDVNLFLQQYCNSQANVAMERCQQQLEMALASCVNTTQRQLLDVLKNANWAGLRYVCAYETRPLQEFRGANGNGRLCMRDSEKFQGRCIMENPLLSMYITTYKGDFCQVTQRRGLQCLREALSGSRCTFTAASFLEGYYQSMVDATPCGACGLHCQTASIALAVIASLYLWLVGSKSV